MLTSVLSPEAQLLLAAGREDEAGADAVRALLERRINWERLFILATQEKAGPVLLRTLTTPALGGGAPVPPERLAQLRKLAMVVEFKMLYLKQRLDETIAVLASSGIDGVLLKGAALGCTVYPSIVDRPMGDIDILVPADRAYEARTKLLAAGWTWKTELWQDESYRDHHHLPPLSDAGEGALRLELHTELFIKGHPFLLSGDMVRRGSRPVRVGVQCVRVPSSLHQLLHACLHFAWSHSMRVGSWRAFRDVGALARRGGIDWDEFVATSRENRAATCSYWTLRLARELMGVEVPERTLAALRPPVPSFVRQRLAQHFAVQLFTTEAVCPSVAFEKLMWVLGVMPGWSGHGSSRPWDESEALVETARRTQPAVRGSAKAVRQLRNLERWGRYVRAVFAPATSS